VATPRRHGQIREQRLGFPGRQREGRAVIAANRKATQQLDPETRSPRCHGAVTALLVHGIAMEPEAERRRPDTFVVQVTLSVAGDLAGLVRHVRTGEKRQFAELDELSAAIRDMVRLGADESSAP